MMSWTCQNYRTLPHDVQSQWEQNKSGIKVNLKSGELEGRELKQTFSNLTSFDDLETFS